MDDAAPPMQARKTFIRAVEVWVPGNDRSTLEFSAGLYGSASRFGALSRQMCFGRGEGLPGQAWEAGRPIVLRQFEGSDFRRTQAARAEGLSCGIALPIFAGDFLTAVLVIFCGDDEAHAGAIELWANDPAASRDMTLDDGYYGTTGDAFEFISRRTAFRKGTGLPGLAWESGLPVFQEDLGQGTRFLRADSALKVGINRGFALPCSTRGRSHYVLAFLSAMATPIVRRFETWLPDASGERLMRSGGFCETTGTVATIPASWVSLQLLFVTKTSPSGPRSSRTGSGSGLVTPATPNDGPIPRSNTLFTTPEMIKPATPTRSPVSTRIRVERLSKCATDGVGLGVGDGAAQLPLILKITCMSGNPSNARSIGVGYSHLRVLR